ncbi:MAG TPA: hypothetical protein VGK67_13295 [Myxococcales bacterium]|jgi:hypothetical protein
MRNRLLTALLALSMAACGGPLNPAPTSDDGCDDPLCSGGFDDKVDPKAVGTLTGTAVRDGAAAEGVTAHLIAADGSIVRTSTDASGVFEFELAPARYKLVLNDARGRGGYESFVLFGGGVNDLGRLDLIPLETVPGIIDLQGVGFEERLTRQAGDYQSPVYDSTRSFVCVARKLGGDSGFDLLKVAIPGGQETVLAAKVDLSSSYSPKLELISDRVLAYWAYRQDPSQPQYRVDSLVFLDVVTGQELASLPWRKYGHHFVQGGALYLLEAQSSRGVGDTLFGEMFQYTWALVRIDLASGARQQGPLLGRLGWASGFALLQHEAKSLVAIPLHGCTFEYAQQHPNDCDAQFYGTQGIALTLVKVDLAALTDRTLATVSTPAGGAFSGDGSKFLLIENGTNNDTTTLSSIDTATGARAALLTRTCATERCFSGRWSSTSLRSPVAEELLVETQGAGAQQQRADPGFARIDLATGALTELPMTWTIEGTSQDLFQRTADWSGDCTASWLPDGRVRLQATTPPQAQRYALVVDVSAGGAAVTRRFPIGEEDNFLTTIAVAGREVVMLRDLATGFMQLWSGGSGAALSAMNPATFLTAHHNYPALTPDGQTLYYFTRDPISGYEQLFRVSLP